MVCDKLKNPNLKVSDFRRGNLIYWNSDYEPGSLYPIIGIVTRVGEDTICFTHFENGFPSRNEEECKPKYGYIRVATKDEALEHFNRLHDRFEEEFANGGLKGAVSARRQHYLDHVSELVNTITDDMILFTLKYRDTVKEPNTGLYVLDGLYSGQGPGEILQGVRVSPRLSERTLSLLMRDVFTEGFGSIPKEVNNTAATSHGDLVGYDVYEIPEKAMSLVVDAKELDISSD